VAHLLAVQSQVPVETAEDCIIRANKVCLARIGLMVGQKAKDLLEPQGREPPCVRVVRPAGSANKGDKWLFATLDVCVANKLLMKHRQ
jgi:hypothetical protein